MHNLQSRQFQSERLAVNIKSDRCSHHSVVYNFDGGNLWLPLNGNNDICRSERKTTNDMRTNSFPLTPYKIPHDHARYAPFIPSYSEWKAAVNQALLGRCNTRVWRRCAQCQRRSGPRRRWSVDTWDTSTDDTWGRPIMWRDRADIELGLVAQDARRQNGFLRRVESDMAVFLGHISGHK